MAWRKGGLAGSVAGALVEDGAGGAEDAIAGMGRGALEQDVAGALAQELLACGGCRGGLEVAGVAKGAAEVFDCAVATVLPNHMELVAMDGDVGMAVGARQVVEFGRERKGRIDQPIGYVVAGRNGEVDLPSA